MNNIQRGDVTLLHPLWRAKLQFARHRFREIVLSRGNTEELAKMYAAWRGKDPSVEPMMKYRGLQ
jgi:Zn-dependent oligopeptidase